jgi:hemoglobin-like flavoprotein
MIDKALGMLGPDIEVLTGILLELGEKHIAYGVKPEYFPSMGRALIDTLGEELDSDYFTEDVKSDWIEVYGALSYDMIRAQKLVKERDMKEEAEEKSVQEEAEKIVKERRHSSPADVVIRKD